MTPNPQEPTRECCCHCHLSEYDGLGKTLYCSRCIGYHPSPSEAREESTYEEQKRLRQELEERISKLADKLNTPTPSPNTEWEEWDNFLNYLNGLSPWNLWENWNVSQKKGLKPQIKERLNHLLESERTRERERIVEDIWKVVKFWRKDGQWFTKGVIDDLNDIIIKYSAPETKDLKSKK